jgi:DNA-binding transcriptional LysR family regulator
MKKSSFQSLPQVGVFLVAAEALSFSEAAKQAGLTPAGVSRAISRLEERLGVALFTRTTRSVRLTEEGELFYRRCSEATAGLREAEEALQGRRTEVRGTLRISVPSTYAHFRLSKALPRLIEQHPKLNLAVSISNRNVNLIEDDFDAAIRMGNLPDSRLVSRKLEDAPLGFYAAPSYLAKHGTPKSLDDLRKHACIPFVLPSTGKPIPWLTSVNGVDGEWIPKGPAQFEDDVIGCLHYCIGGGGIKQIFKFIADEAVQRGELVQVLKKYSNRTRPFSLIYRRNTMLSAKIIALSTFLQTITADSI